jgi:hypothetical protein
MVRVGQRLYEPERVDMLVADTVLAWDLRVLS